MIEIRWCKFCGVTPIRLIVVGGKRYCVERGRQVYCSELCKKDYAAARHKHRYRNDPGYRARSIEAIGRYRERFPKSAEMRKRDRLLAAVRDEARYTGKTRQEIMSLWKVPAKPVWSTKQKESAHAPMEQHQPSL